MSHASYEGVMVKTTNGVAFAGIFSPAWLPTLNDTSQIAAQFVPILSLFWLVLQIVRSIRNGKVKEKSNADDA